MSTSVIVTRLTVHGIARGRAAHDDAEIVSTSNAFADTIADRDATLAATGPTSSAAPGASPRITRSSTVLPRIEASEMGIKLVPDARTRYEIERILGQGGMGVVDLALDQDIERKVAIKRIKTEAAGDLGVARFVEEVRTIGRLEHPNIVPVHDVGIDDEGRYYLVMKYVEGETIEQIIEKLRARDPEAMRRYSFEVRAEIFAGLLRALSYAHDRGIIHRDIKPANVMVGPYGEVVLMDWGVARPIKGRDLPAPPEQMNETIQDAKRRLVQTEKSGLVGTPMYMSPEQARGQPDLDERSDLYSACVLFQELLALDHYLADKTSLPGVLTGVISEEIGRPYTWPAGVPAEYIHFTRRGMQKKREDRWQSAAEMIAEFERIDSGQCRVQCPCTLAKRTMGETGRFVDRHPMLWTVMLSLGVLSVIAGIAGGIATIAMLL
jgi:serine/threonine protein kinase